MLSATVALLLGASAVYAQSSASTTFPLPESNVTAANVTMIFTNPVSNTTWEYSQNQTIMWTAPGPSDPQNISLLLANVYNSSALPGYPVPLALNILSSVQNFSLANVSLPVGEGFVILMADIYNSSNIVGANQLCISNTVNTSTLQYAQGGFFNVSASTSTESDSQGTGFSVASTTTIVAGAPAGGDATATMTATDMAAAIASSSEAAVPAEAAATQLVTAVDGATFVPEYNSGMGSETIALPTRMAKRIVQRPH